LSADEVKEQLKFEREVTPGDEAIAHWTNCGHYYETEVEVVAVNAKSFRVKIAKAIEGYPVGWTINVPNFLNIDRWTWNNRLAPQQVDPYQECLEAGAMPGNLEEVMES